MKKRILSILLLCCMVLTLLPTTVLAADGPMDTIPKYDVSIDVYNRTSDISIKDSRSYYIYSSVPDKLRDTWAWDKKIFIKGDKAAPHVFIDGVNIKMSPSSKGPAIELNKKASAYLYFIGKDSTLQGADGRAAIQKNRSEGQLYVLARTGTTVTCKGGYRAAGIGGSWAIRNIGDSMFNMDMYGHGVNMHFGSQSNPDYWGGTINATGGEYGAGIGAGSWGHSGHSGNTIHGGAGERLYFYSGTVNASGGRLAAGIGGGFQGRGSHIYIYGGNIDAQGGDTGAGIGGGSWTTKQDMDGINAASDIVISGGRVSARGQYNCAGIGGGQYVPARNITITGGHVSATGHYGAAIGGGRVKTAQVDADSVPELCELFRAFRPDIVINVALPYQDLTIMDACLECGVNYLDTANYEPRDEAHFEYSWQWAYQDRFREKGLTAILGCGFDPGVTAIFTAYAAKHHFDEIHYLDIVDCNAGNHGMAFATNFNPEINIREVTQKGRYFENGEWVTTEPHEIHRTLNYPGIGERESYVIYHEELESLVKNYPTIRRARFWMTFGQEYLTHLRVIQNIGMARIDPIIYNGVEIVPIQFLKAVLPDPKSLGANYHGQTSIGCRIRGIKDGKERTYYIYNNCDHEQAYRETGTQAVSFTTGVPAALGASMWAKGLWRGAGVFNVEEFDPDPFLAELGPQGLPWVEKFDVDLEV